MLLLEEKIILHLAMSIPSHPQKLYTLDFYAHTCPFQIYRAIKALYGNSGPPFARPKIFKKLEKAKILSFFSGYGLAVKIT